MHGFALLSDTTTYLIWRIGPRMRIPRPEWHSGVDLCKIPYANFYEKALFVNPTWRLNLVAESNSCLPFARGASIRTFGEPRSLW
jgi:hypothetical protein